MPNTDISSASKIQSKNPLNKTIQLIALNLPGCKWQRADTKNHQVVLLCKLHFDLLLIDIDLLLLVSAVCHLHPGKFSANFNPSSARPYHQQSHQRPEHSNNCSRDRALFDHSSTTIYITNFDRP